MHADGLSSATQKRAKPAVVAAAMALADGEEVTGFVCGQFMGEDGVAVLTDRRVLCINGRTFAPDQDSIGLGELTDVKGWIEGNRATLQITGGGHALVVGDIREVESAQKFAGDLRSHL